MAKIQVARGASLNFDQWKFGIGSAKSFTETPTVFAAHYGPASADGFLGRGFTYDAKKEPTGGTITDFQAVISSKLVVYIAGFAMPMKSLISAARTASSADDKAFWVKAFAGNDTFEGDDGNDVMLATAGKDILSGGAGNDILRGGTGSDTLAGGLGKDTLTGGAGNDMFVFTTPKDSTSGKPDVITDFRRGRDTIDLSSIDADTDGAPGNQEFTWIGSRAFSRTDGELRFSGGFVQGDMNGDGKADFRIKVAGLSTLSDSDFNL